MNSSLSIPDRLAFVQTTPQIRPILTQTHDLIHAFVGANDEPSRCRLRIYQATDAVPVVIATELDSNPGQSITAAVEYIAAEVLGTYLRWRVGETPPFIWIEHYPARARRQLPLSAPDLARVTFADATPRAYLESGTWRVRLAEPSWERMGALELRCLIGREVDLEG